MWSQIATTEKEACKLKRISFGEFREGETHGMLSGKC